MKFLLFGKDGQVGRALQRGLPALGHVVALGRTEADLEMPDGLVAVIEREHPDVIVNAAAYTAVDAAEEDKEAAVVINAKAVAGIGRAAKANGALVVHYSTDYVFEGQASGYLAESEPTSPISVYGASKLAGETLLRDSGADHLIFRSSWVYAPWGKNFALTVLRLAKERDTLDVVADEVGAPTPADLIGDVTVRAIPLALAGRRKLVGLYHLAPAGETTWHRYAQLLVAEAITAGVLLSPSGKSQRTWVATLGQQPVNLCTCPASASFSSVVVAAES